MVVNIAETLNDVAQKFGERVGLIEARSGTTLSFAELNSRSDCYAAYLTSKGVAPGDRVMLMVTPSADFICLTFALFKIGVTIILIDPGMGYKNLLRCIEGVKPTVFIGIPKARLFAALFPKPFKSVNHRFCCGKSLGIFGRDIRSAIAEKVEPYPVYQPAAEDLAAIIFTTGSTGPPKGVRYEHSIFAAQLDRIRNYYGIDETHIDQPAFPLFALFSTALGACAVIPDLDPTKPAQVNPEKFIASIEKYNVSYSFGSPAIWNVVSRYCIEQNIRLKSLKKVLMAGAPVPGELLERVINILPEEARVFTPYGATESLPIVSMEGKEILEETWPLSRIGKGTCVGRPLPGIELRVIAIDDNPIATIEQSRDMPVGEIGEIVVKGDVVTRAYENNEEETRHAKIRDGNSFWHRMGDTGYLDEQGRLWFCGRKAHRVVTGGTTLFSIPCESIVNEHQEVFRSALVGARDEAGNEVIPVLIIEPISGFTGSEAQLLKEVRELAGASPLTKAIQIFMVHRDFPVDIRHNAKIFREKLAVWATEQLRTER